MAEDRKSKRGFASMAPERLREIASKGGKSIPSDKRAFSKDRKLAAAAGKKGGLSLRPEARAFSTSADLASVAGKLGVKVRAELRKERGKPKPD